MKSTYIAADFGGGSGRIIAGTLSDGKLVLEEIHRFPNKQIKLGNHIYWDFLALFEELKTGLKIAGKKCNHVKSIGIDTWGVDFGLIDKQGNLLGGTVCYRDERTNGMPEKVFNMIDKNKHYAEIGIQIMNINTLFQLFSMKEKENPQLLIADKLLFTPDLFSYFLTGTANNEYCIASTSELIDAKQKTWSASLINELKLPANIFGEIIQPGTSRGKLKQDIAQETGLEDVSVIAVASHDTASAVLAIPSVKKQKAFLSSGTWSLLGALVDKPILTNQAREAGFTNEGGVNNIRFLQNITGLWILQKLMEEWKEKGEIVAYGELIKKATDCNFNGIIDVDDESFTLNESMSEAIQRFCTKHNQQVPSTHAEFARCVIQSLAKRYKKAVDAMNELLPEPISELHIIGGGSQNVLLNKLTAKELNIPVFAGPVEATAMGNILMQALAAGEIQSLDEFSKIIIHSTEITQYTPD